MLNIPPIISQSITRGYQAIIQLLWKLHWVLVFILGVITLFFFIVTYAIFPNIDSYRNEIEGKVTEILKQPISIEKISVSWNGVNPVVNLYDLKIHDKKDYLPIHQIKASISWNSLFYWDIRLSNILVDGLNLELLQDRQGKIHILYLNVDENSHFPNWLLRQPSVVLSNAKITWHNELKPRFPLVLEHINMQLEQYFWSLSPNYHKITLSFLPREGIKRVAIKGGFTGSDINTWKNWDGDLDFSLSQLDFSLLQHRINLPYSLVDGQGDISGNIKFSQQQIVDLISKFSLHSLKENFSSDTSLSLRRLSGSVAWKRLKDRQRLQIKNLILQNQNNLSINGLNVDLVDKKKEQERTISGEVDLLSLELIQPIMARLTHYHLIENNSNISKEINLTGSLNNTSFNALWNKGVIKKYSFISQLSKLSFSPFSVGSTSYQVPGFRNLTANLKLNESEGTMNLQTTDALLNYPFLFRFNIPIEKLLGTIHWQRNFSSLSLDKVHLQTPHLRGTVNGELSLGDNNFIDLKADIPHGNLSYISFYLPTPILSKETLAWLDTSILSGVGENVKVILKGNIKEFPFVNNPKSIFKVMGNFSGIKLNHTNNWPDILDTGGEFLFEKQRMLVNIKKGNAYGNKITSAKVVIPDLIVSETELSIEGNGISSAIDAIEYIKHTPLQHHINSFLTKFSLSGEGKVNLKLHLPLFHLEKTKASVHYQLINGTMKGSDLPSDLTQINGTIHFTENSASIKNLTAKAYESPLTLNLSANKSNLKVSVNGSINNIQQIASDLIRKIHITGIGEDVFGNMSYSLNITTQNERTIMELKSKLRGITVNLPPPFGKNSNESRSFIFRRELFGDKEIRDVYLQLEQDLWFFNKELLIKSAHTRTVSCIASVKECSNTFLSSAKNDKMLLVNLPNFDGSLWLAYLKGMKSSASPNYNTIEFQTDSFEWEKKRFPNVKIYLTISPKANLPYKAEIYSDDINGTVDWSSIENGHVKARFKEINIYDDKNSTTTSKKKIHWNKGEYPTLDLQIDELSVNGKRIGNLRLLTKHKENGVEFDVLKIENSHFTFETNSGGWNNEKTKLDFNLDVKNIGETLKLINDVEQIKNGSAMIKGKLNWMGDIFDFQRSTLNGGLELKAKNGRFLEVKHNLGSRLLSILSLQSLPRRLFLDFKDFSGKGLTFDNISAKIQLKEGIASSDDFQISSSSADIKIKGNTNLDKETQHFYITINPHLDDVISIASLAGGPVVGAATYITQKILGSPFNKLNKKEYEIVGTWSEPKEVKKTESKQTETKPIKE